MRQLIMLPPSPDQAHHIHKACALLSRECGCLQPGIHVPVCVTGLCVVVGSLCAL